MECCENDNVDRIADRQQEGSRIGYEGAGKEKREHGETQACNQGVDDWRQDQCCCIIREHHRDHTSQEKGVEEETPRTAACQACCLGCQPIEEPCRLSQC